MTRTIVLAATVLCAALFSSAAGADTALISVSDATETTRGVPVTMPFPLTRSGDTAFDTVIDYHAIDGTALVGIDYMTPVGPYIATGNTDAALPVILYPNTSNMAAVSFQVQIDALLGVGNAPSFASVQNFDAGSGARAVAIADFNGDGRLDLAVANHDAGTVSVLLNITPPGATTPTFATAQTFSVDTFTSAVVPVDLNGDGRPDIVAVNSSANDITVLMNETTPGAAAVQFGTQPSITVDANVLAAVAVDLDGDGATDLVVAGPTNNHLALLRNTTPPGALTASFAAPQFLATESYPLGVGAFDLNGDGKPDLVSVNYLDNSISVFVNSSTGSTLAFNTGTRFATGTGPEAVAAADLNGDGTLDLIVTNQSDNTVSVFDNTTAPGAASVSLASPQPLAVGNLPFAALLTDVNGDGKPDIVVVNDGDDTVSVLRNLTPPGAAQFRFDARRNIAVDHGPFGIAAADLNGDGVIDLVTANHFGDDVSVLLNATSASGAAVNFGAEHSLAGVNSEAGIVVADFNGDGRPDFAAAESGSGFLLYLNQTPIGSSAAQFGTQLFGAAATPNGIGVADINGDGKPDVILSALNSTAMSVSLNTTAPGATSATFASSHLFGTDTHPMGVCVADFNGDGKPDIATGTFDRNTVSVVLNTTATGASTPTFAPKQIFTAGNHDGGIACADLDGDGKPDIVTTNQNDSTISILHNTTVTGATAPSFDAQQTFAAASGALPDGVAIADINGDGIPDILVANLNAGKVSVFVNTTARGGGAAFSFAPRADFNTGSQFGGAWVAVSDVDGDGKPDLIVPNQFSHSVSVLLNATPAGSLGATFILQGSYTTPDNPAAVALADVNGDGRPDVLTANAAAAASVLLSTQYQTAIGTATATGTIVHDYLFANGFEGP